MDKYKNYYWKGINKRNESLEGIIKAKSRISVKIELHEQDIRVQKIVRQFLMKKIKKDEILVLIRQLLVLFKAGIPLIQCLDIVNKSQSKVSSKQLIKDLKKQIERGSSLSESLALHPLYFDELCCQLIAIGERSGKLELMLAKVIDYKEKIASLKQNITKALTYPLFVISIAVIVISILFIYVMPQFISLFDNFGIELPLLTQIIISFSLFFKHYCLFLFLLFFSSIFLFLKLLQFSKFRLISDTMSLKIPLVGQLLLQSILSRFFYSLAICTTAALPFIEALDGVKTITKNTLFKETIHSIKKEVYAGFSFHFSIKKTLFFPSKALEMIAIGEESGTLEQMLYTLAEYYEEAVDTRIERLSCLLEPFIMIILGLILGCLIVGIYLPIFKLGTLI